MYSAIESAVKAISRVRRKATSLIRVLWYNATNFSYYAPLPLSTTVYGRILVLDAPTRVRMGRNGKIGDSVYFATGRNSRIDIGERVFINIGCVIVASELIEIGPNTSVAEYVTIRDQEHRMARGEGTRGQGFRVAPVKIGAAVWIGRGVYIGPGASIGDGCVVAANSVVKGTFPPNVLIAGAPAVIKKEIV